MGLQNTTGEPCQAGNSRQGINSCIPCPGSRCEDMHIINVCILYRVLSLSASTALYLLPGQGGMTKGRLLVAAGMITAGILGIWLYKKCFASGSTPGYSGVFVVEAAAQGFFISMSGGFASPYLWYSVSALTLIAAIGRHKAALTATGWYMVCALVGNRLRQYSSPADYSEANVAIGFLILAGGFCLLSDCMRRLEASRRQLIETESKLQEMTGEYIIYEERSRIAAEIHDTVIQKLFAVICRLDLLAKKYTESDKQLETGLTDIRQSVESTMKELREAIYNIRWETDGFQDRLSRYMSELQVLSGTEIDISPLEHAAALMTASQKTAAYRILCEAANNAVRHGKASLVKIAVARKAEGWVFSITDDGTGFDPGSARKDGQGLQNMVRLAGMLGGSVTLSSSDGKGTAINVYLPR